MAIFSQPCCLVAGLPERMARMSTILPPHFSLPAYHLLPKEKRNRKRKAKKNKYRYFIDRNPQHVDVILDFLRMRAVDVTNYSKHDLDTLAEDLDFFQIRGFPLYVFLTFLFYFYFIFFLNKYFS